MNYKQIYFRLCIRGQYRTLSGYTERHHIVPRSLGGSNDPQNITTLTAREHWIAHKLLVRILTGLAYEKMVAALVRMIGKRDFRHRIRLTSKEYDAVQQLNAVVSSYRNKRLWANKEHRTKVLAARRRGYHTRSIEERKNSKRLSGTYYDSRVCCIRCKREYNPCGLHSHVRQSKCWGIRKLPALRLQNVSCMLCRKLLYSNGITNHYRYSHSEG